MSELINVDNLTLSQNPELKQKARNNSGETGLIDEISNDCFLRLLSNSEPSTSELELKDSVKERDESVSDILNKQNTPQSNSFQISCDKPISDFEANSENVPNGENIKQVQQRKEYRDSESSWSEDEDSSSSDSSDSDFHFESIPRSSSPKVNCVKTKGELDIEDLPPIEYLKISVEKNDLKKVGKVHAIVVKLVVIQASKDEKPLDIDTVLFLGPNEPLGRIFEVFGPVIEPFYTILFNSNKDIIEKGVEVGSDVYFAPLKNEITSYVFIDVLRQQKGSDASWKDNNEPPEEHLDYSDDEQERAAKLKRKGKNRVRETDDDEVQIIPYKISHNEKRTFNYNSYTRNNSFRMQNFKNSTQNNSNSIQNNRNSVQNNRNSMQNNGNNLDNVPIWISEPPPYMEPNPLPSQARAENNLPVQSFQLRQPASLPTQNQSQPINASNSSQPLFNNGTLTLNPKQPFIPRQPPNSQRVTFQPPSTTPSIAPYFPTPPQRPPQQMQTNGNAHYFSASEGPPLQMRQNMSQPMMQMQQNQPMMQMQQNQPMMFQNRNQHIFGQLTPVGVMSPVPPMSPAMFSPCPSPAVYVAPNRYSPLPSLSPRPFWRPQNQQVVSFNSSVSPSPTSPLTIQIPTFSSPPPAVNFSTANNISMPPPHYNNFSTPPYQYPGRF